MKERIDPTFILGGAPKCATTAIAGFLREHPRVFFTDPKEPFYWCDDFPGMRRTARVDSQDRYSALFNGVRSMHQSTGEGSTLYLCSDSAIPKVLESAPNTKFVFGVRKPQEIANAFHTQLVSHEFETELDFQKAWDLQVARAAGENIPAACPDAKLLQYRQIASVGTQLNKALQIIPHEKVLVFLFDDFRESPAGVYHRILRFLEIEDDGRTSFPKINSASAPRSEVLIRMARHPIARSFVRKLKQVLPAKVAGRLAQFSNSALKRPIQRTQLDPDFMRQLDDAFEYEIGLTSQLLGLKLGWQASLRGIS